MHPQSTTNCIAVSLSDMVPILMDAVRNNRLWLQDFADDVVQIPSDLHEILVAYQCMIKQDAA